EDTVEIPVDGHKVIVVTKVRVKRLSGYIGRSCGEDHVRPGHPVRCPAEVGPPASIVAGACELLIQEANRTFAVDRQSRISCVCDREQVCRRPDSSTVRGTTHVQRVTSVRLHIRPGQIDRVTLIRTRVDSNGEGTAESLLASCRNTVALEGNTYAPGD